MREFVMEEGPRETIELRSRVDSYELDRINAEERIHSGRGFTRGGSMRAVSNIQLDYLHSLVNQGDRDAVAFAVSGYRDATALRRLCARYPQFRCSEGAF